MSWNCQKHISAAGNDTLRVDYVTEYRALSIWYLPRKQSLWSDLCMSVFGKVAPDVDTFVQYVNRGSMPQTLTVKRDKNSKFYSAYAHNRQPDEIPN